MQPTPATSVPRRLLWHGAATPLPRSAATVDGEICGPLEFEPGTQRDRWHCRVGLGTLPAGTLCVPSLILGPTPVRRYRMHAQWRGGRCDLVAIAITAPHAALADWPRGEYGRVGDAGHRAEAGIDCFEATDALAHCSLEVVIDSQGGPPEVDLAVSLRPRLQPSLTDDGSEAGNLAVPHFSQMTCSDAIARHICSPVSVAMILGALDLAADIEGFAQASRHPDHGLFGIWPSNLAAAWRAGASGVVRSFDAPAEAARILAAGYPIVASIRFEAGGLTGAPLERSAGHLVVLRGMGPDTVLVNDPAGASADEVERSYERAAFLRAWLGDRGVGYVLWSRGATNPVPEP